jgi:hypothetical protein
VNGLTTICTRHTFVEWIVAIDASVHRGTENVNIGQEIARKFSQELCYASMVSCNFKGTNTGEALRFHTVQSRVSNAQFCTGLVRLQKYNTRHVLACALFNLLQTKRSAMPTYLSIDVGVTNLGMSFVSTNEDYSGITIEGIQLVDLKALDKSITPYKTNYPADQVGRLVAFYHDWFRRADHVLIEAQPLNGCRDVEQVLLFDQRAKAEVVYPSALHSYYRLTRKTHLKDSVLPKDIGCEPDLKTIAYNARKEQTIEIASQYLLLHSNVEVQQKFQSMERKHRGSSEGFRRGG